MKSKTYRFLGILLAVLMACTVFPVSAMAAGGSSLTGLLGLGQNQQTAGPELKTESDGTVRLYRDGRASNETGFVKAVWNGAEGWYYVENGKCDTSYVGAKYGTINGNSGNWYVEYGKADETFSGTKTLHKVTWTVKDGKVTKTMIEVPKVDQLPKYPTGCEAASSTSLLNYYGVGTTVDEMIEAIPRQNIEKVNGKDYGPSIYEKFVGDPTMTYTSPHPGYGAFAPVVTKAMNSVLKKHNSQYRAYDITGTKPADLYKRVRSGQPVVIWATYNMKTPTKKNAWYIKDASKPDGEYYFEYPRGTHVLVLCGVDDEEDTITIMDPYHAVYKTFDRQLFESKYALLGQMAIEVK